MVLNNGSAPEINTSGSVEAEIKVAHMDSFTRHIFTHSIVGPIQDI
jgi:hypothetical protein